MSDRRERSESRGRAPDSPVPISMGSPRFTTRVVPGFEISDVWFPPGAVLPSHVHERAVVAVCIEGRIESRLGDRVLDGSSGALWTEPAGDAHSNVTSSMGARVVALLPDPERADLLDPVRDILESPANLQAPATSVAAVRLHGDIRSDDACSGISLQAHALGLLAEAGRAFDHASRGDQAPSWLARVEEMVRDRFRERLPIERVAEEAGVHPMHLTRVFRKHLGMTVPALQRKLRLDWAEVQLRTTNETIGRIALRAGFSDQSHFTRVFRRYRGCTPGAVRREGGRV